MSSLEACMRKVKGLTKEDQNAIRAIRDDLYGAGDLSRAEANQQAVDEYQLIIDQEREFIINQVEGSAGVLVGPTVSHAKFSEMSRSQKLQEHAKTLESEARKFPRKGTQRPPVETRNVDYKTGEELPKGFIDKSTPEQREQFGFGPEPVTERTWRSVEYMFGGFFDAKITSDQQVVDIVAQFDVKAARNLDRNGPLFRQAAAETILEWVKEHETLPLRWKVEEVNARLVDEMPEHPAAQVTKWGAVNQAAHDAEPVVGNLARKSSQVFGNMGADAALTAVPQSKLKDFVRYGMESVKQYVRLNKRMDGWMNARVERYAALAKEWLEYANNAWYKRANPLHKKGAKILGELMHASTLVGVDVASFEMPTAAQFKKMNKADRAMWKQRKIDYAILKPFWDELGGEMGGERVTYQKQVYVPSTNASESGTYVSEGEPMEVSKAQSIYLRVRDTYADQRTELIENLDRRIMESDADHAAKIALIARLRKQFETNKIVPYFPLGRFGKHWGTAKHPETGETVGFIKRESKEDRNAWLEKMREMGFVAYPSTEQATDLDALMKIDPQFVADVTELVSDQTMLNEEGKQIPGTAISEQIWQMYLHSLPEMSARKAYIHREGRAGFTHDALRTFSDRTFHQTHQMGKLRFGYRMNQLVNGAFEDADQIEKRLAMIENLENTTYRPPGFDKDSTVHEVLMDPAYGIPEYVKLYSKYKKAAGSTALVHQPSADKALEKIKVEAKIDGPWAVPLANELRRRHAYNMNPRSAKWSTEMTKWGFLWFLSTSPAAGILNLTQTPISAYPILRAEFTGQGAGQALLKASKEFASVRTKATVGKSFGVLGVGAVEAYGHKLKNDTFTDPTDGKVKEHDNIGDRAALIEFGEIGTFSKTRTRELMGFGEKGVRYSTREEQFMEITGYIFHKTEEMNRVVTAMAAYRLAREKLSKDKGLSKKEQHDKAVLMAEEMVEMSHYDYTNTNRPRFMQGDKGRVAFLFRNYSLNMQYRLIRDFKDAFYDPGLRLLKIKNPAGAIPKEDIQKARTRFLGLMGMSSLFVGVSGMPMFWALAAIANSIFGDDDEPYDMKTAMRGELFNATSDLMGEVWGEKIADAIMRGPWTAFTQADLSQRASLNNLWIRDVPEHLAGKELLMHLTGESLGPIWGAGANFFDGANLINQGHTYRGVERMMPKSVTDVLKTIRFATQGAQNYSQDLIMAPEEFSNYEKFLQFIGFSPSPLTLRYEQNRAVKDMSAKLKARHKFLLDTLFRAYNFQDRALVRETMIKINAWNRANPNYVIDGRTLQRSARTRQQYDMRTVGGIALDKRLQYLHEELRFTQRPKR